MKLLHVWASFDKARFYTAILLLYSKRIANYIDIINFDDFAEGQNLCLASFVIRLFLPSPNLKVFELLENRVHLRVVLFSWKLIISATSSRSGWNLQFL